MAVVWQSCAGGARVLRVLGDTPCPVVPDTVDGLPVVEIGKVFDNRDHSTVLYSLKQVEKQMKKDPAFAETVKEIKTNINNRH